jgi:flagellar hook-basal body complex protein FliE
MASPLSAAGAYAAIARLTPSAAPLGQAAGIGADNKSNTSFSSVLKQAIDSVEAMGKKSDAQATAAANGKANMVDVVTAVSETEVAIDAVVAVRDKIIAAYEDIMKMPI